MLKKELGIEAIEMCVNRGGVPQPKDTCAKIEHSQLRKIASSKSICWRVA